MPPLPISGTGRNARRGSLRDLVQGVYIDCNRFSMATLLADGIEKQQEKPLPDDVRACIVDADWQMSSKTVIESIVNPEFFTGDAGSRARRRNTTRS